MTVSSPAAGRTAVATISYAFIASAYLLFSFLTDPLQHFVPVSLVMLGDVFIVALVGYITR